MRASQGPHSRGAWLLMLGVVVLSGGCAAGRMSNMWRDESFQAPAMKNVLVVAVRGDVVRRRMWEDGFVNGFTSRGAKATPSYSLWVNDVPDTQQVIEAVRRDGYDGVLVNMRHPDGTQQTLIPGYNRREAVTKQSSFTGAYYTVWREVQVPDRVESNTVAIFQTDVWTPAEGGRLVWSGTSATTDGVDVGLIKRKVEKSFLPEMTKAGIVPAKPN